MTTPRPYLSWSQMNTFERSLKLYQEIYFEGRIINNPAMDLGKELARCLETNQKSEDKIIEYLKLFLPSYDKREYEIQAKVDKIPLLGKLDGFLESQYTIGEYKTGKLWTQKMVDNSGQLTFYALLVYLKYKKLPNSIRLHWMPTIIENETVVLTGDIKNFETQRTLKDISLFIPRIKKTWKGIKKLAKEYAI